MSAIVASSYQDRLIGNPSQEHFVNQGLKEMSGRAPGEIGILRNDEYTVLGQRESRVLSNQGWSSVGAAQCKINIRLVSLVVSGYIDNVDEISNSLGVTRESCNSSVAMLLLKAYIAKGKTFVNGVGGSFAIVIKDSLTDELHLIRDRFGIEPLYFWNSKQTGKILVASEPKAIIADPEFPRVFDDSVLLDLFNSTSRVPGTTVYKHLYEVRPGEILSFQDGRIRHTRYWTLPQRSGKKTEKFEAAENIAALVNSSIKRRVNTAGCSQAYLLSGGLDSSIICTVAQDIYAKETKLTTFSFAYPEEESNFQLDALHSSPDGPYVDIMKKYLGTNHEKIIINNNDFREALEKTVLARDLPGVGDLDITLLWLFQSIKEKGRDEIFSGEGADDIFGGFPWFDAEANLPSNNFPWLSGTGAANFLHPDIRQKNDLNAELKTRWSMVDGEMPYINDEDPLQQHMDKVFYMQITRFLPFLLDRVDRMSAAAGVRTQLPFLDHRLIEYVWDLAYRIKTERQIEKGILRKAFEKKLPADIAWRKKSGFAVVKNHHYISAVINYLKDMIATENSTISQIIDMKYLNEFINKIEWSDGKFSAPPILPRIVMLDLWMKLYGMKFESSNLEALWTQRTY